MTTNTESMLARRYLLGQVSEEECTALEQDYLERQDAMDRIAAAEDDLIEDYLAGELGQADRDRFERFYLPAPNHRVRVETIRRLKTRANGSVTAAKVVRFPSRFVTRTGSWLAMAASLVVVASLVWWLFRPAAVLQAPDLGQNAPQRAAPAGGSQAGAASTGVPRVFALTISPVAIRGASDSPAVVVPAGVDVVAIGFESDADNRGLVATRAAIRTVAGDEVWRGPVAAGAPLQPGTVARVEVQTASLPADDYLVTLYGADGAGVEHEWDQYFLRVRSR